MRPHRLGFPSGESNAGGFAGKVHYYWRYHELAHIFIKRCRLSNQ